MTVVVRADAGVDLGVGHIVRCSALIQRLGFEPESVVLVTRSLTPGIRDMVDDYGWAVRFIGDQVDEQSDAAATLEVLDGLGDVDLVVIDHYSLGAPWENAVHASVGRIAVIDDLADRRHSCDVLIDPTLSDDRDTRYRDLVDESTTLLLGPAYVLLGSEFDHVVPRERSGEIHSWLVYLGGATSSSDLEKLLSAFHNLPESDSNVTVVLGRAFMGTDAVTALVDSMPRVSVLEWTDRMPDLLLEADCAIGATGGAQWERCVAGLPTLTVLTADNQEHDAAAFEAAGATRHLGPLASMTVEDWRSALEWAHSHTSQVASMAAASANIVAARHEVWDRARELILGKG